ncbi:PREDICTED: uncharacterized protein LOC106292212 [Brassica oleracea var. oleracea]|uniref:uncharacterized protein LOC106292212 n=1 Tax=Brassica oleracea var. oleracea TaxID=109376 RepID=UPI0006A6AC9A|nr:PREDICTED: uncharacterized protein LOC106292212 [Brassica oleracea var. oleracea]
MKKKSKKSPPAKAKSLGSPPIENSPPPSSSSPPSRDEGSLLPPLDEFVSDAHLGSPAAVAAQQTRDKADLSPPVEPSSAKKVIVEESTDPSPGKTVTLNTQVELSSEAMSGSSSDSRPVGSVANEITVAAEPKGNLASADAKDVSLGSQLADPKEPPIRVSIEKEAKAPIDTKKTLCDRAKGVKQLSKKGEAFTLPSGEACIKIPNSVIEKNRKSWEPFVLGQFYSDPPSQGTLHNIVNGIWSKQYRDIAVSKMEGFSYLFRIPNVATRNRVIKQKLWQIEGQTMFVDKWEPGIVPTKPELTSAPIWLELRKVPLQFFNEDGLERIAGLVGHPKFLHPATANKTNLEVAKVFTIIDPRKPLPEAVNVQFDSGVINRVLVSSPWMPPVCGFCKEIGHSTRRCPTAPKSCSVCSSTDHASANCPQAPNKDTRGRKTRRSRSRNKQKWVEMDPQKAPIPPLSEQAPNGHVPPIIHTKTSLEVITLQSKLGTEKDTPELQSDSSDVDSSDSELEEGEFSKHEPDFEVVRNRKRFSELFPGWSYESNYEFSPLGKIWVVWHPSVLVTIISKSLQMITVEVTWPSVQSKIIISIIYASNDPDVRTTLWNEIEELGPALGIKSKPWIILGDFNQIRDPSEHSKPASLNLDMKMRDFNQCLQSAGVDDLNFRGSSFTWWNKQKLNPIAKKLDRALVNDEWYFELSSSVAYFGSPEFSDHAVVSILLDPSTAKAKKPFRVSRKLKLLKKCIKEFSKHNYSGIEKRTAHALDCLVTAQNLTLANPSTHNAEVEIRAMKEWEELSTAESSFFFQRSRITWQAINHIHFLVGDNGARIDSLPEIHEQCVNYFSDLLGGTASPSMFEQSDLDLLFDFKCSAEQASNFEKEFSSQDIKDAFFSLPRNKTGGPDGYSSEFFTASWSVVGSEITEAIKEFFRSGSILKQWNAANLVLIPKIPNASHPSEFRPISCLNTVYKVIAKLLASRLQEILPLMISKAQSAFLPRRLLAENVCLSTDLVNGYNNQNLTSRGMLKVDLRKAFDSVRWDFMLASLKALEIPQSYINLISQCLTTASFSVSVNGSTGGFFQSSRGITQGDPLSPYLFVLAMECFSRLLLSRYEAGSIGYHPRTENLKISHLMFADDVMVFFDGSSNSLHEISECLDDFASWSGLHMNTTKTELFTAGLDHSESQAIASYAFPIGKFPIRYLGLPLMSRKLKISEYAPLMNKITKSFQAWSVKLMSFAGRLQLLRTVIFGLINFWVSAFMLPKGYIAAVETLCARFLWSGNIDKKGIAKIAWTTMCLPKQEGGLSIRSIYIWNQVLGLRFIWLLLSNSPSLWSDWHKSVHLTDKSLWTIEPSPTDSWAWKRILKLRPLALQFCNTVVGNGVNTSFWYDVWTPFGQLINHLGAAGPRALRIRKETRVAEAINGSTWSLPHPRSDQEVELHSYLTTLALPLPIDIDDVYEWKAADFPLNVFKSQATWEVLRPRQAAQDWYDIVWFKGALPKHAFTMWVTNYDRLPTRARLASWGLAIPVVCPFCHAAPETRDHLFLSCQYSFDVWSFIFTRCSGPHGRLADWNELLSWIRAACSKRSLLLRKLASQAVVFHIWKQRNKLVHNNIQLPAANVFREIDKEMKNIISSKRSKKLFSSLMVLWIR